MGSFATRRFALLATSAAVLASGGTIAVQAMAESQGTVSPALATSVNAKMATHFSVLDGLGTASASRNADVSGVGTTQTDPLASERGANKALAIRSADTPSGDGVVLTPTQDGACLGTTRFGVITCTDARRAVEGALAGAVVCSPQLDPAKVAVFAIVPNGVFRVAAELTDGTTTTYNVRANTIALELDRSGALPVSFTWTRNGKVTKTASQLPLEGVADANCAPAR